MDEDEITTDNININGTEFRFNSNPAVCATANTLTPDSLQENMNSLIRTIEHPVRPVRPEMIDGWETYATNVFGGSVGRCDCESCRRDRNPEPRINTPTLPRISRRFNRIVVPRENYQPLTEEQSNMEPRSKKLLDRFTNYCNAHPEERFWQALRNFGKEVLNPRMNFLLIAESDIGSPTGYKNLQDTFYAE